MKVTFTGKDGRAWTNEADIPDNDNNDIEVFVAQVSTTTNEWDAEDSDGFESRGPTITDAMINLNYQRTKLDWDNDISMFLKKLPAIHYR